MRKNAGFKACSACMLAAAAAAAPLLQASAAEQPGADADKSAKGQDSGAAGDIQGSARLEAGPQKNEAGLTVRLVDDGSQIITASRIDIQLEPQGGAAIKAEDVTFEFDGTWDDEDITVKTCHYDEQEKKLTILIATNGKKGLMEAISDEDKRTEEVKGGVLRVEAEAPVTARVAYSTVAAGGTRLEVPSVGGSEVTLEASKEPETPVKEKHQLNVKMQLDSDPDYNFHIDLDGIGGSEDDSGAYKHEDFKLKVEKKDGESYTEIEGSPFTVVHGELDGVMAEDGTYRLTVLECPEGYRAEDPVHEAEVSGADASYTFVITKVKADAEQEEKPDGRVVTPIRFNILVKDNEGNAVGGATLRIKGGSLGGGAGAYYTSNRNGEISVTDEVEGVLSGALTYDYAVTRVPDGYDKAPNGQISYSLSGSTSFTVLLNKSAEKDKVPVETGTRDVTLRVIDEDGLPVRNVVLDVGGLGAAFSSVTNDEGTATIPALPYGSYEVTVSSVPEGYEGAGTKAKLEVSKTGPAELTLSIRKGADHGRQADIGISVKDDRGLAVQGAEIRLSGSGKTYVLPTGANGRAVFMNLPFGTYAAALTKLPDGYVAIDISKNVTLGKGGAEASFKVREGNTRDITVTVTGANGKPAAGITVRSTGAATASARTDDSGIAVLKGMKLGTYKLYVTGIQTGSTEFTLTAVNRPEAGIVLKRTPAGTGGSSGGSGGGGGSHSAGHAASVVTGTQAAGPQSGALPAYVVIGGTWARDQAGAWTYFNGRPYANEWAAVQNPYANTVNGQMPFEWFRFGLDGKMLTGWFTDADSSVYYLNPSSDGTQGRMYTGWNWIDDDGDGVSECYFFETASNGHKGSLYRAGTTPDGYTVNEKGQWTAGGQVIRRNQ